MLNRENLENAANYEKENKDNNMVLEGKAEPRESALPMVKVRGDLLEKIRRIFP